MAAGRRGVRQMERAATQLRERGVEAARAATRPVARAATRPAARPAVRPAAARSVARAFARELGGRAHHSSPLPVRRVATAMPPWVSALAWMPRTWRPRAMSALPPAATETCAGRSSSIAGAREQHARPGRATRARGTPEWRFAAARARDGLGSSSEASTRCRARSAAAAARVRATHPPPTSRRHTVARQIDPPRAAAASARACWSS